MCQYTSSIIFYEQCFYHVLLLIIRCFIVRELLQLKLKGGSNSMSNSIQQKYGIVIKELRNSTGLSQEKFALQIGMDRTYYASVESGKRNISIQNIEKIANGLAIPISDIFIQIEKIKEVATND